MGTMRTIELVARITPDSAQALWYELENGLESAGGKGAISLNAAAVRHLSAAALQVLLVASRRAERDGTRLKIVSPSPEFVESLRLMGASALVAEGRS